MCVTSTSNWSGGQLDVAPSAQQAASNEREIATVSIALEQLPAEQRLTLTLVAIEGKTHSEAAEILDVPVGTIMSRIARGTKTAGGDL